jgi:hypothetical protein
MNNLVGVLGRSLSAMMAILLMTPGSGRAQCEPYVDSSQPSSSWMSGRPVAPGSVRVKITKLAFSESGEAPAFRLFFKVMGARLKGESVRVQVGLDLALHGYEAIETCLDAGMVSIGDAGSQSYSINFPLGSVPGDLPPRGLYRARIEVGRTGSERDRRDNNVDSIEVEYEPKLVLTQRQRGGQTLAIQLRNDGLRPTGPLEARLIREGPDGVTATSQPAAPMTPTDRTGFGFVIAPDQQGTVRIFGAEGTLLFGP